MNELPDESVQCVVTSPPYWGLRKYSGLPDLIWGGDGKCEHQWEVDKSQTRVDRPWDSKSISSNVNEQYYIRSDKAFCSLCGAWKGAYGLEPTPEMYVRHTLEILREIRRVLRKDGVVFWNIGDSYMASQSGYGEWTGEKAREGDGEFKKRGMTRVGIKHPTIKPKDLCLIPFRVAIAAQEDGWWVRSVIIWSKPNPMPESVTDRPTESHEYILMLTKSKNYYWDADAVREPHLLSAIQRAEYPINPFGDQGTGTGASMVGGLKGDGSRVMIELNPLGRNIRTVWEFCTKGYPEAHFAVFPEKLPEICIKAATPEVGCCSKCGVPWGRITEPNIGGATGHSWHNHADDLGKGQSQKKSTPPGYQRGGTIGWQPTCKCNADKIPSLVLDPFMGSGTTLWVAKKLGRNAVGYELSEEYCKLAIERNRQQVLC